LLHATPLVTAPLSLLDALPISSGEINHQGLERSVRGATNDTTAEIGALLLLLGLSVSIGGVIERSHIMETFPQAFDSPWSAMLLDRKSTRLNSSHVKISYAVFC